MTPCSLHLTKWENAKGSSRGGYPARGIPSFLNPLQDEEHLEPGPLPPRPDPPPLLHL